ncbi:MAG: glycosyltransferase, partial [Anaerolineae bacterium]|nr:glycosyltransferase [Anaerolineae bacterium]
MHIRLLALGSRGDVQPYIALALGLKDAGFDVSIGTTGNFKTFVEGWGLEAITSDTDMEAVVRGRSRRQAKWDLFRILLDTTYQLSQGADVLVYSGAALFTAPHVAEKFGIPAIPALAQPAIHPTRAFPSVGMPALAIGGGAYNRFTYGFVDWLTWTFTKSKVNQWRHDVLGLPPATISPMQMMRGSGLPTLFGFSPSVLPKPAEWDRSVHVTG